MSGTEAPAGPTFAVIPLLRLVAVTPRMTRLTLGAEALRSFDPTVTPARGVKVFVPPPGCADPIMPTFGPNGPEFPPGAIPAVPRSFTIRRLDVVAGELDIDVARHGDGAFTRWLETAVPGNRLGIAGPRHFPPPPMDADAYVLAADESALAALATMLEYLADKDKAEVHAFAEVAGAEEEQALARPVTWLHRGSAGAGTTGRLENAVGALAWPAGRVYAWLAGEGAEMRSLRAFLSRNRGLDRGSLHAAGYWRRGRTETELDVVQMQRAQAAFASGDPAQMLALDEMHLEV